MLVDDRPRLPRNGSAIAARRPFRVVELLSAAAVRPEVCYGDGQRGREQADGVARIRLRGRSGAKDRLPTRVLLALSSSEASPPALATTAEQRAPQTLLKIDAGFFVLSRLMFLPHGLFRRQGLHIMLAVASAAFASGRRRLTAFCRRDRHKQCRRQVKTGKLANQAKLCARFVPPSGPTCLGDKNPEPHSASGACSLTLTASRGPSKPCGVSVDCTSKELN